MTIDLVVVKQPRHGQLESSRSAGVALSKFSWRLAAAEFVYYVHDGGDDLQVSARLVDAGNFLERLCHPLFLGLCSGKSRLLVSFSLLTVHRVDCYSPNTKFQLFAFQCFLAFAFEAFLLPLTRWKCFFFRKTLQLCEHCIMTSLYNILLIHACETAIGMQNVILRHTRPFSFQDYYQLQARSIDDNRRSPVMTTYINIISENDQTPRTVNNTGLQVLVIKWPFFTSILLWKLQLTQHYHLLWLHLCWYDYYFQMKCEVALWNSSAFPENFKCCATVPIAANQACTYSCFVTFFTSL